nr:PIN domain-containing protein [bacterium]
MSHPSRKHPLLRAIAVWLVALMIMALLPMLLIIGYHFAALQGWLIANPVPPWAWISLGVAATISILIALTVAPRVVDWIFKNLQQVEKRLLEMEGSDLATWLMGLIVGLIVANLLTNLVQLIPIRWLATVVAILVYLLVCSLSIRVFMQRKDAWMSIISRLGRRRSAPDNAEPAHPGAIKVLDTSAIIDGRIFDVWQSGFLEGRLVVPDIVLTELRHIADSEDATRRVRGRRGLDLLAKAQEKSKDVFQVMEAPEGTDADDRILRLAKQLSAQVVTNDFNLNKAAGVLGVRVLNINELTNALKNVVQAGEKLTVQVMREGKEPGQGVAYLADGTMIVIESGRPYTGKTLEVVVTGNMQTAAGRLIFARPASMEE